MAVTGALPFSGKRLTATGQLAFPECLTLAKVISVKAPDFQLPVIGPVIGYHVEMEQQSEMLESGSVSGPTRRANSGSFLPGDQRINREGRPRGSKAVVDGSKEPRAARADRLMRFLVPDRILRCCMTRSKAPWLVDLPSDYQIVDCQVDSERDGIVFVIRSAKFQRIARGTRIPEFEPTIHGLLFCR